MKTIDVLFIISFSSIIIYSYLKPGRQLPPPSYDIKGRMEYKSTPTLYISFIVLLLYLILK